MKYYFDFFGKINDELIDEWNELSRGNGEIRKKFVVAEELISPPEIAVKNILNFARSYHPLYSVAAGYVEINLN